MMSDDTGYPHLMVCRQGGTIHPVHIPTGTWELLSLLVGIKHALAQRFFSQRQEAEEYKDRLPARYTQSELYLRAYDVIQTARQGMAELEELRQVWGRRDEQRLQELIAEREREYAQAEESNGT